MDGGRHSQKDLIWEAVSELLADCPVLKAFMAGRMPSKAGEGSSRKTPGSGMF